MINKNSNGVNMFNAGGVHKNKICSVIIIIINCYYYYLHYNGWKGLAEGNKLCIAHCYRKICSQGFMRNVGLQAALTAVWLNIWLVCHHNINTAVIICHVTLLEDFDILNFTIFFPPKHISIASIPSIPHWDQRGTASCKLDLI